MNQRVSALLVLTALLSANCSNVEIFKLTSDGNQTVGPEGMRYYLSRPYVHVHTPFPLDAQVYLVSATISADGQHATFDSIPSAVKDALHVEDDKMPTSLIRLTGDARLQPLGTAQANTGRRRGDTDSGDGRGDGQDRSAEPGDGRSGSPTPGDTSRDPAAGGTGPLPGQSSVDVTYTSEVAHLALRNSFDLVYLPDYDEQYVVKRTNRLGSASAELTLGPGNVLMGMGINVDNNALVQPLIKTYSSLLDLGMAALSAAAGVPGIVTPTAQASTDERRDMLGSLGGQKVTLKVTVMKMAAVGLYPILKPAEIEKLGRLSTDEKTALKKELIVPVSPVASIPYRFYEAVVVDHLLADRPSSGTSRASPPLKKFGSIGEVENLINTALAGDKLKVKGHPEIKEGGLANPTKISAKVESTPPGGDVDQNVLNRVAEKLEAQHPGIEFDLVP